jgi:ATP-dependent DNA helicase 2 subunit 1
MQTRRNETGSGSEIKKGTYVFQPMSVINAPKILDLNQLIDGLTLPPNSSTILFTLIFIDARSSPGLLSEDYPPTDKHIPVGDLFTSCNWVLRDGYRQCQPPLSATFNDLSGRAPKSATKRVFLITDNDDPLAGSHNPRLITSARTTLTVSRNFIAQPVSS